MFGVLDSMLRANQIIGLIVFLSGIALLAFTYFLGYSMLTDVGTLTKYANLIPLPKPGSGDDLASVLSSAIAAPLTGLASYIIPVLILFVLGYIASKISFNGIQMWRARSETREEKEA